MKCHYILPKRQNVQFLSLTECQDLFSNSYLLERNSFFIVDKEKNGYDKNRISKNYMEEVETIAQAFSEGYTVKVENLEQYTQSIRKFCAELSRNVDVHAFVVPPFGTHAFSKHSDDKDVILTTIYGKKKFLLELEGETKEYTVSPDEYLYIPKGVPHRAIPSGPSFLLSFGIPVEEDYSLPSLIELIPIDQS